MTAQTPATPEISLVEAVWRYRLMSLVIVLACVLASIAATQILFGGATATARFAVTDPTNNNNALRVGVVSGQGYATYTAQRAAFAGSTPVMARAAEIVRAKNGPNLTGEQLRSRVETSSKPDGGVVVVTATGDSMPEAAAIANAVLQAYQEVTVSTSVKKLDDQIKNLKELQRKVTQDMELAQPGTRAYKLLANQLAKYQAEESGLLSARSKSNDGVQFLDTADPSAPTPSKLPRNSAIGFALGAILACIVSFLRASTPHRGMRAAPVAGGGTPPRRVLTTGPIPELPSGSAAGRAGRPGDRYGEEPPAMPERGRGRRARGRPAAPPEAGSSQDTWLGPSDDLHGSVAPSASATHMIPATPPVPPADRDRGRSSRLNGAGSAAPDASSGPRSSPGRRGTRVAGNGSSPSSGKTPRRGSGSRSRGAEPVSEPEMRSASDLSLDPLLGASDPTRTVEDLRFVTDEQLLAAGKSTANKPRSSKPVSGKGTADTPVATPAPGKVSSGKAGSGEPGAGKPSAESELSSGKKGDDEGEGKDDSPLMRFDLDR